MSDDELFIAAVLEDPEDAVARAVYADWLEERSDPRSEFLRLDLELAASLPGDAAKLPRRTRLLELRPNIPENWLLRLGFHRTTNDADRMFRFDTIRHLDRAATVVDDDGYERTVIDGAIHPLRNWIAYVECRSQQQGSFLDIHYHLHLRDERGCQDAWEIVSYNPYFGCDVQFLEWYGDTVVFIYREKHNTYIARFGLEYPAQYKSIGDRWMLEKDLLAHGGYRDQMVNLLRIPNLLTLRATSTHHAAEWDLLPPGYSVDGLQFI